MDLSGSVARGVGGMEFGKVPRMECGSSIRSGLRRAALPLRQNRAGQDAALP